MYNRNAIKSYEKGRILEQKRKLSDAERAYKKAIKINQNFVEAHNNLGNVLLDRGRLNEASNAFRKALKYRPDDPMFQNNLGNALQLQGDVETAIDWFNRALARDPGFAGAYSNLGNALRDSARYDEAVAAYRNALKINPGFANTYYNLGITLIELDDFDEAVIYFNKAIEIEPGHKEAYNGLGNALAYQGRTDEAIAAYRQAIEIDPRHNKAHNGLGNALSDMGEIDEAITAYRQAIQIDPGNTDVYRTLSINKKFSNYDEDIRSMESLYASERISDAQKVHLAFGLGKAYEDLGEYDKSMVYILEANRLNRASIEYSTSEAEELFSNIKQTFSSEFLSDRKGMGFPDRTPIFILGMPRSGTSLVEQILASHPGVYGAGELKDLPNLTRKIGAADSSRKFPGGIVGLNSAALEDLGNEYITRIRIHSEEARHVTDKMPPNFLRIGFIKAILPNAKVIHCTRDPMDNCLSLFKNYFSDALHYSYDQIELGHYYNLYHNLMKYWSNILPGFIYDLSYESLVADPEMQIKQLLKYCHLPWNDSCLDFHKTRRKVRTASNAQVRRPIYQDSVKLWKRYEGQLESLQTTIYG